MHRINRWAASLAAVAGLVTAGGAWAQDHAKGQQQGQGRRQGQAQGEICPAASAKPVLSVGDFNGDTLVDGEDVRLLAERLVRQDNVAFFDMNADGRVNMQDLRIVTGQVGARSTAQDHELAAVFRATERYRDLRNAIADDFIPYTQSIRGHGVHWARRQGPPGTFELTRPQGLNYSEDGRLLAVFYSYVLDGTDLPDAPPVGLSGDEPWHGHYGACFPGVDPSNPTYDFRAVSVELCVPRQECRAEVFIEKIYMIHLWLYEQNPCGVFGFDNPRITVGAGFEEVSPRCPPGTEHGIAGAHGKAMKPAGRQPMKTGQQARKGAAPRAPICLPPAPMSGAAPPAVSTPPAPSPAPAAPAGPAPHTHSHSHAHTH